MSCKVDVLIVGGGLAGLTAALHLHKAGLEVILIEKDEFPHHKVCGEYISNEVLPYLKWLDIDIAALKPTNIKKFELTTLQQQRISTSLPLGGFGVSRYALDHFLYKKLIEKGIKVIIDTVNDISFQENQFTVTTQLENQFIAKQVIGAYGKRATLDKKLNRLFIAKKSHYLAVKGHYKGNFRDDLVALHNFKGGYCGVSKVENGIINICYLADYNSFKTYKNIETYQKEVLYQNTSLKKIFEETEPIFDAPLTISQVSFVKKSKVENHILMVGDTAGLIHPLCGNGMAMAIHSAKIASELLILFFAKKINSRMELENKYGKNWNKEFSGRIKMGNILSQLLRNDNIATLLFALLTKFPFLLTKIIKKTHGSKISIPL
ncbi:MAG: NAD(P)/FAD-dependent oxidoreductase [Sphingobacteriaceae bacterium]|nr:NAD(P)/FAD-dependent oxidoreductase [Sphingobacteriaceae bacterium]